MSDEIVSAEAVWYVRAALGRYIFQLQGDINDMKKMLEEEGINKTMRMSGEGMIAYNQQLLNESRKVFAGLPKALKPNLDD